MRWLLLAAAALVAALLLFLLRDDEPVRHETRAPDVPLSKEDFWRKQRTLPGDGGGQEPGKQDPNVDPASVDWHFRYSSEPEFDLTFEVIYEDGTPAEGATVRRTGNAAQLDAGSLSATTDKAGIVTLRVMAGRFWYYARRGALVAGPKRISAYLAWPTNCKLRLGESYGIRGVVLRPDGGPAAEAKLSINFWDGWRWRFVDGTTMQDGTFDALPVPLRWIQRMHIYVTKEGIPRNLFQWDSPRTDLRLQLTSETVRGRVVYENGAPAANVQVNTGERALKTDKDGRFEVAFQKREGALLRVNKMVRKLRADDRDIEIMLKPGRPLHGRLLTHDRKPLPGAWIGLSMPVGGPLAGAGTDADGRFQFLALAEGPHRLRIRLEGAALERARWGGPRGPDRFNVPDFFVRDVHATNKLLEVVLPKPIPARIRLRREDGRTSTAAKHVTLIVRTGELEILKRTWAPGRAMEEVSFLVWEPGAYNILVTTALHDPAQLRPIRITETGRNSFDLPLRKKRHVR